MSVTIKEFDRLSDGSIVHKITLTNKANTSVSLLTLGAAIQAFCFDDKDIVLGFDRAEDYLHSGAYIGATVGRVCNRTADGRFILNDKEYTLFCNEPDRRVHLHGGAEGFDKKIWDYAVASEGDNPAVAFSAVSPDGEEGYPGNLSLCVTYTLTEDNALVLEYVGKSDADTPVNLTNHVYFNLNGCDGENVHNHYLQVNADRYTPVTQRLIPTGEYAPVADTAIDFRSLRLLADSLNNEDETMQYTGGVDHNFVLNEGVEVAACAYSPATGIRVCCETTMPGLQVYTGNFLDEPGGKYGYKWGKHQGFCLETQYFPNSVNQPSFPSIIRKAGETFTFRTVYRVDKKED